MKALVVYDTKWGNTEKIANAIAMGLGKGIDVKKVATVKNDEIGELDLLVIGSPVLGGRPTKALQEFMKAISKTSGSKMKIAAFDTRMTMKFAQKFGFASERMIKQLKDQENSIIDEPIGFIVKGQKGPLEDGEMERAIEWGKKLLKATRE
jgi:flavodoxin